MAMSSRHRLRLFWAGGLAAVLGMLQIGCTVYPAVPAQPAFDTDVLPIFEAHCTRCHGAGPNGGALNNAYIPGMGNLQAAAPCLNQFGNNSNSYTCPAGAASYATRGLIWKYIQPGYVQRMPPPPAPLLDPWEMEVIDAWISENAPCQTNADCASPQVCTGNMVCMLCSRSSNPDPALLCNSM
jgi:hypothetical protein